MIQHLSLPPHRTSPPPPGEVEVPLEAKLIQIMDVRSPARNSSSPGFYQKMNSAVVQTVVDFYLLSRTKHAVIFINIFLFFSNHLPPFMIFGVNGVDIGIDISLFSNGIFFYENDTSLSEQSELSELSEFVFAWLTDFLTPPRFCLSPFRLIHLSPLQRDV